MKSTPFVLGTHLAPIPFDRRLYDAAEGLKEAGLSWTPHVGCFVRDPEAIIPEPSPFPDRVYFILNLGHVVQRFGSLEAVVRQGVFLPTIHQCHEFLARRGSPPHQSDAAPGSIGEYLEMYAHLQGIL